MTKDLSCFSSSSANSSALPRDFIAISTCFFELFIFLDKNFKTNPLFFNRFSIKISDALRRLEICLNF